MEKIEATRDSIPLSVEKIIDLVRSVRNDLINDFLKADRVSSYFEEQFNKKITNVKKEFLKRDLKELLIAPVDLVYYAGLINQIKETNSVSISDTNREFFYKELDKIFKKYSF